MMGWDESELRGRLAPLEKGDHSLSNEQLNALKAYVEKSGEEHEQYRSESRKFGPSQATPDHITEASVS